MSTMLPPRVRVLKTGNILQSVERWVQLVTADTNELWLKPSCFLSTAQETREFSGINRITVGKAKMTRHPTRFLLIGVWRSSTCTRLLNTTRTALRGVHLLVKVRNNSTRQSSWIEQALPLTIQAPKTIWSRCLNSIFYVRHSSHRLEAVLWPRGENSHHAPLS